MQIIHSQLDLYDFQKVLLYLPDLCSPPTAGVCWNHNLPLVQLSRGRGAERQLLLGTYEFQRSTINRQDVTTPISQKNKKNKCFQRDAQLCHHVGTNTGHFHTHVFQCILYYNMVKQGKTVSHNKNYYCCSPYNNLQLYPSTSSFCHSSFSHTGETTTTQLPVMSLMNP